MGEMFSSVSAERGLVSPPHVLISKGTFLISADQCYLSSFPSQIGWEGAQ